MCTSFYATAKKEMGNVTYLLVKVWPPQLKCLLNLHV